MAHTEGKDSSTTAKLPGPLFGGIGFDVRQGNVWHCGDADGMGQANAGTT